MRAICFLMTGCLALLAGMAQAADLGIVGVKIYPSPTAAPIADAVILIHDGLIVQIGRRGRTPIPAGYTVLDRTGDIVTAGFWNSHVHLIAPQLLDPNSSSAALSHVLQSMFTRWGFTTVFDLASTMETANAIRSQVDAGRVDGPHVLTVGAPFYPHSGTPVYAIDIYRKYHLPSAEIQSIPQAVARVDQQAQQGANGIKLFTGAIVNGDIGVLVMPADQVRAIADEAHRQGLPVFAHTSDKAGLDVAVDNGVDIIAHIAPLAGPWGPDFIARLKARHIALIPTLTLFVVEPDSSTSIDVGLQQVKAQAESGGDILFGTDAGFMEVYDTTQEYQLMGRVLDWRAILASLTTTPARRFGQAGQAGRVETGLRADLVVLDGDPAKDVANFAKVRDVIQSGRLIYDRVRPN